LTHRVAIIGKQVEPNTAVGDFDAFIAAYPKDRRVAKARVLRAMANVRQYVSVSGGTWSTALEAARVVQERTMRDRSREPL